MRTSFPLHRSRRPREVITRAAGIGRVAGIRIYTRLPVVIPQPMTAFLTANLTTAPVLTILVIFATHANKIDLARTINPTSVFHATMRLSHST